MALNVPIPTCPACMSIKSEDWGEEPYEPIGLFKSKFARPVDLSSSRSIDATLRRQADRHGLTNMSNKDGIGTKSRRPTAPAQGQYTNIALPGGGSAPVDYVPTCTRANMTASLKVETGAKARGRAPVGSVVPTRVVGSHSGQP